MAYPSISAGCVQRRQTSGRQACVHISVSPNLPRWQLLFICAITFHQILIKFVKIILMLGWFVFVSMTQMSNSGKRDTQ